MGIFYRIRPKKYPFQFKSPSSPRPLLATLPVPLQQAPAASTNDPARFPRAGPRARVSRLARRPARALPRAAASSSSSSAPGDASGAGKLEALLAAIRDARAAAADAETDDDALAGSLSVDAARLAERLAEAERENAELRAKVAELTTANEDAVAELLEDAAELASAVARAEDLEEEAEALRELNDRLATAAEEVAAMVSLDDTSTSSSEEYLAALRSEAEEAKAALAVAEARASADRSALLARIRSLEIDLAEAEGEAGEASEIGAAALGASAAAGAELEAARAKVDALAALAQKRGDDLLDAEAAASAADAEVQSLKRQLEAARESGADARLARVRELEAMIADMLTAEEALASESAKVRSLEATVAEMADPEEVDALLALVRSLETRMADMVDAEELEAANAKATALEKEADALRARVRRLEEEMASMSYDDEIGRTEGAKGATDAAVAAFVAAKPKPTKPGTQAGRRSKPFERADPASFKLRTLDFAKTGAKTSGAKTSARRGGFVLRRMRFPPSTRTASANAATPKTAGRSAGESVVYSFSDAAKTTFKRQPGTFKKRALRFASASAPSRAAPRRKGAAFARGPAGGFALRRFDFPALRAKVAPARVFTRAAPGSFSKRRLVFNDGETVEVGGTTEQRRGGAFARDARGAFTLRRFDFVKAKSARDAETARGDAPRGLFRRSGTFRLRRFTF